MLYEPIVVKVRHFGSILNFQYIFSPHSARFVFHPCPLCVPASPACPFFPCSVAPPPHLSRPPTSTARPASIACIVRPAPPRPAPATPKIRGLTVCRIPHSVRAQHPVLPHSFVKKYRTPERCYQSVVLCPVFSAPKRCYLNVAVRPNRLPKDAT